jgi:chromate transporter
MLTPDPVQPLAAPKSPSDLFLSFTALALQGFGGVIAIAQRVLCEEKRWLSKEQFLELLAASQILGDRFHGWRGAFAALAGMMSVPLMIVLLVTEFYSHHAANPAVSGALRGMGAVSAGLFVGTALRLVPALRKNPMGMGACAIIAVACFAAVALLRWPLVGVLLGLGTVSCAFAWSRLRA